jgi:4-hydroxybenzoate polyprenyltransferase
MSVAIRVGRTSPLTYLRLLRPRQMTKNLFCLGGVLFSDRFGHRGYVVAALLTLVAFSVGSSAVYVVNDVVDRERDRQHPTKRLRPVASGDVSIFAALTIALVLACSGFAIAALLPRGVAVCLALYLAMNLAYTCSLKHLAIVDVVCIALGFVLRLLGGIYAVDELPTAWITLCTLFLTLFLGFCKRRSELARLQLANVEQTQRPVLSQYTVSYLDQLVNSTAVMAIMCYALFSASPTKNPSLVVTVPLVFFGIMHYKGLVMVRGMGEEPERVVMRDLRLLFTALAWLVAYFAITLGGVRLFR